MLLCGAGENYNSKQHSANSALSLTLFLSLKVHVFNLKHKLINSQFRHLTWDELEKWENKCEQRAPSLTPGHFNENKRTWVFLLKFQVFQIDIVCSFVNISSGAGAVNRVELVTYIGQNKHWAFSVLPVGHWDKFAGIPNSNKFLSTTQDLLMPRSWLIILQSDGEDELKKRQLMELAIINGTYRDSSSKNSSREYLLYHGSRETGAWQPDTRHNL